MLPEAGKTPSQFTTRLRQRGNLCKYGSDTQLQQHIRDHLIATTKDSSLQQRLLAENQLALHKTMEILRISGASRAQSKTMSQAQGSPIVQVGTPIKSAPRASSSVCNRCSLQRHTASYLQKCSLRGQRCLICKAKRHFAVCCHSKSKPCPPSADARTR